MRRTLGSVAAIALMLSPIGLALAHEADQIGRKSVAALTYGESAYPDAVEIFGEPNNTRRVDGCVPTLIAKWPGIKLWFDRSRPGDVLILGFVRARSVPTADGDPLTIHTGKDLRVEDTVRRLKRLYPDAERSRGAGDKRQWQLSGRNGGAFLGAITDGGRVVRLLSGFTC